MTARPSAVELIEAAREHLEARVLPVLSDPRLRFQTLVAAHVLRVVERELTLGEAQAWRQWEHFATLLGRTEPPPESRAALEQHLAELNAELCAAIRAGQFDEGEAREQLVALLHEQITDALEVWNPEFLARVTGKTTQDV